MANRRLDVAGRKFNRLAVIRPVIKGARLFWECRCDCGSSALVRSTKLVSGHTKSCGCLDREAVVRRNTTNRGRGKSLSGQRFGRLLVLAEAPLRRTKAGLSRRYLSVRCECGSGPFETSYNSLIRGWRKSCGCLFRETRKVARNVKHGLSKTAEYKRWKCRKRRAAKTGNGGTHTIEQFAGVCELQGWRCAGCNKRVSQAQATEDHIVPLALGGSDAISNIQMLCSPCNSSKGAREDHVWRKRRGKLI